MTKRHLGIILAVMTTLLALVMIWQFRLVAGYFLVSLALASALRPLVTRLYDRKILLRITWVLVYLLVLGVFGFLFFSAVRSAIAEIQLMGQTIAAQDAWVLPAWLKGSPFQLSLLAQLPSPSKIFAAVTGDQGQLVLPALLGFSQGFGGLISDILIIFLLSVYWSLNQVHFERLWLSLLPSAQRKQARGIWRTIEVDLGRYIRSEVFQSLAAGLLLWLGYRLIGSPFASLLALIGALAWLIPVVGAFAAVILPLLLGLLTGIQMSLWTALYTLVVLIVLQVWLEPRLLVRRKWDKPFLTMIFLLAMADAYGLLGILLAPPLSAVSQILWENLFSNRAVTGAATQISDLKERQARAWENIQAMDEPPMALMTNSMERLSQLIEKAEPVLREGLPAADGEPPPERAVSLPS